MKTSVVQSPSSTIVKAQVQSHAPQHQSRSPYPSQPQPQQPSRVARRRSLVLAPAEGWLALVLLAVALYCVNFVITAATWVDHTVILNWIATIGLVVGLIVAKVRRLPQPLLHIVVCLAGYWLSVWLVSAFVPHISWPGLIANLEAVIVNPAHIDINSTVFPFYLSFLCFFLGYFGAWLVYRAHLPWLVAIVYCAILIVYLRFISHDLSYVLVIALAALILLIARVRLSARLIQWKSEGLCMDRQWLQSITSRFMLVASLIAMCALLISWMLPIFSEPSSGVTFWNYLENAWSNMLEGHISWQEPGSAFLPYLQPTTNFFGDQLTLPGSVKLPTSEVLFYTYPSTAKLPYLMGSTYDNFDGHTWTSREPVSSKNYNPNEPLPNDGTSHYTSVEMKVTIVQPPGETKHYLFAPGQPSAFDVPTTLYASTVLNGTPIVSAWAQQFSLWQGESYQVDSLIPNLTSQDLSAIPLPQDNGLNIWKKDKNYRTLKDYYLQFPTNLSPRVEEKTWQWTEHAKSAYDALLILEARLSDTSQFTYSQDNLSASGDGDAVSWLLRTRRGYCTYYATAMTIMARQLGIPARIVTGFSSGHYDAHRNVWVVDGTDAHSWVQAYFPEIGWLNFDPTPGYALHGNSTANPKPTPVVTPPPAPKIRSKPPSVVILPANPHSKPVINSDTVGSENMLLVLSMLMVLLSLVIFVLALLWRRWSNLYADRPFATRTFWRLCCIASLVGLTPRKWQTPYEYSRRLCQQIPQEAIPLWHLSELFVRERWAGPHQLSLQTDLTQVWPGLRRIFWLLLLVKLRKMKMSLISGIHVFRHRCLLRLYK